MKWNVVLHRSETFIADAEVEARTSKEAEKLAEMRVVQDPHFAAGLPWRHVSDKYPCWAERGTPAEPTPVNRCAWCMCDVETGIEACPHCGLEVHDPRKPHRHEWSRKTLDTVECKICKTTWPMDEYLQGKAPTSWPSQS